jgi:hypothetical protein
MSKAVIAASAHNLIPYRRGVFQENARYDSLTILEMDKDSLETALKTILKKEITTGDRAKHFLKKELEAEKNYKYATSWSYCEIDLHGRVGILKYKGIEIALFIKRQLSPHRISTETPVSERKLNNSDDAWMRLDLSGLSARQSKKPTLDYIRKLEQKLEKLQYKNETLVAINDQQGARLKRYEKKKSRTTKERRHSKDIKRRHSKTRRKSGKSRR